jgi:hypothetical protein
MEILSSKKLYDVEVKKHFLARKLLNGFGELDASVDVSRVAESIGNYKTSAKQVLSYYDLKQDKLW